MASAAQGVGNLANSSNAGDKSYLLYTEKVIHKSIVGAGNSGLTVSSYKTYDRRSNHLVS